MAVKGKTSPPPRSGTPGLKGACADEFAAIKASSVEQEDSGAGYSARVRDIHGVQVAQDAQCVWLYQEGQPAGIEIRSTSEGAARARALAEFLRALAQDIEQVLQYGGPPAQPETGIREPSPLE